MCEAPKMPDAPKPPPPPPPPAEAAPTSPVIQEGTKRSGADSRMGGKKARSGSNALRIDLNVPQPSGQGLSIPRG